MLHQTSPLPYAIDRKSFPETAFIPERQGAWYVFSVIRRRCKQLTALTLGGKKVSTKEKRWYKDVGLGYKTPAEAINGTYIGASAFCRKRLMLKVYSLVIRQEMPLYWRHLYPWTYSDWQSRFDKNDPDRHHSTGLSSLYSQIQCVYANDVWWR